MERRTIFATYFQTFSCSFTSFIKFYKKINETCTIFSRTFKIPVLICPYEKKPILLYIFSTFLSSCTILKLLHCGQFSKDAAVFLNIFRYYVHFPIFSYLLPSTLIKRPTLFWKTYSLFVYVYKVLTNVFNNFSCKFFNLFLFYLVTIYCGLK